MKNRQKQGNGTVSQYKEGGSLLDQVTDATQAAMEVYKSTPPEMRVSLETSLYPGAQQKTIGAVVSYCKSRNLDPLQKPVHIVPMSVKVTDPRTGEVEYEQRDVIMPGIGLYRIQAEQTGLHLGTSEPEFGPAIEWEYTATEWDGSGRNARANKVKRKMTYPEWARVTVTRLVGEKVCTFSAKEYWIENYATESKYVDGPNSMWGKRTRGQIGKCAEAQALRRAFPGTIGQQATFEELAGKELEVFSTSSAPDHGAVSKASLEEKLGLIPETMDKKSPTPTPAPTPEVEKIEKPKPTPEKKKKPVSRTQDPMAESKSGFAKKSKALMKKVRGSKPGEWEKLLPECVDARHTEAILALASTCYDMIAPEKKDPMDGPLRDRWKTFLKDTVWGPQLDDVLEIVGDGFKDTLNNFGFEFKAVELPPPAKSYDLPPGASDEKPPEESTPFSKMAAGKPEIEDPIEALRVQALAVQPGDMTAFLAAQDIFTTMRSDQQMKLGQDMTAAFNRAQEGS